MLRIAYTLDRSIQSRFVKEYMTYIFNFTNTNFTFLLVELQPRALDSFHHFTQIALMIHLISPPNNVILYVSNPLKTIQYFGDVLTEHFAGTMDTKGKLFKFETTKWCMKSQ